MGLAVPRDGCPDQKPGPPNKSGFGNQTALDGTVGKDELPYWSPLGRGGLGVAYAGSILGVVSFPFMLFFGFVSLGGTKKFRRLLR
jgi:hypothetical protein